MDEDLRAAREACGLARLEERTRIALAGNDRTKFISNLCTNDIVKLPAGTGCETFFLNAKGKILDYGIIYALADRHELELEPGRGVGMMPHLDRYLFREDVRITDETAGVAQWHLCGPRAAEFLSELTGQDVAGLPVLGSIDVPWRQEVLRIRRRPRSLEGGFDLLVGKESSDSLRSALLEQSDDGPREIGPEALEVLRVEAGLPKFGAEVTEENLAQEIGRDAAAISFTKGCYLGQETVARLDALGHVNRLLRGLVCPADAEVAVGAAVSRDGKALGKVSSTAVSPRWGKRISLGVLRVQGGEPGSEVTIESPSGPVTAEVSALPFSL